MTYEAPIYERMLDDLHERRERGLATKRATLAFEDWQRLVMMIGTSTATVKIEYGKLTWLTKYGEIECVPGDVLQSAPRYEP